MASFQPLINSFGTPQTGGTTSPLLGNPSFGAGTLGSDQNIPSGTLKSPLIPIATTTGMGARATQPMLSTPSNSLPSNQTAPQSSIDYTLHNGESINDYNARIAAARGQSSGSSTATPTPPPASTGLGTGGGPAGPGMMYNGQGQQVPVSSMTNPYTNTGAPPYTQTVGALASTASQPSPAFTQAQQTADQALKDLQTSRTNEANALSLNAQNPIPLEFQQGRGQILQNQYLQQQNAYANTYQGATAQEQAATGQQGTQQTGLNEAANLTAPQQVNPTNVPFSPTTGQYGNPAATAYGSNGLQGVGNIGAQMQIGSDVATQNAVLGSAQSTGGNLQNLITQNNINPSAFTPINGLLQVGAQYTSNPAYQEFAGQVNDFVSKIAPLLGGPGGATTDMKTQMATQILNASASGQSINQVISYFLNQAQQNIKGYSAGGGANGSQPQNSGSGNFYSQNWFQ